MRNVDAALIIQQPDGDQRANSIGDVVAAVGERAKARGQYLQLCKELVNSILGFGFWQHRVLLTAQFGILEDLVVQVLKSVLKCKFYVLTSV